MALLGGQDTLKNGEIMVQMSICWIPNNCPQEMRHPFTQSRETLALGSRSTPPLSSRPLVYQLHPFSINFNISTCLRYFSLAQKSTQNFSILNKHRWPQFEQCLTPTTGLQLSNLIQTSTFITSTFSSFILQPSQPLAFTTPCPWRYSLYNLWWPPHSR